MLGIRCYLHGREFDVFQPRRGDFDSVCKEAVTAKCGVTKGTKAKGAEAACGMAKGMGAKSVGAESTEAKIRGR